MIARNGKARGGRARAQAARAGLEQGRIEILEGFDEADEQIARDCGMID